MQSLPAAFGTVAAQAALRAVCLALIVPQAAAASDPSSAAAFKQGSLPADPVMTTGGAEVLFESPPTPLASSPMSGPCA